MRPRFIRTSLILAFATLILGSCAPLHRQPIAVTAGPENFPEYHYRQLAAQGDTVFRVDSAESLAVVEVRRTGALARLGHDHIVASHDIGGYVVPDGGRVDLYIPLAQLTVDEPALRSEAGLDTQLTASDIEGTRSNMLDKVLEVDQFPYALIRVEGVDATVHNETLSIVITLHGETRTMQAQAKFDVGVDLIEVTGRLAFDQTDFGIEPYSLFGGALAVMNRIELSFHIRARRFTDTT